MQRKLDIVSFVVAIFFMAGATRAAGVSSLDHHVVTTPEVVLTKGMSGVLPCIYENTVHAIYWKKGETSPEASIIIALDEFYNKGDRTGPGIDGGRFNITDDYSLVFHEVLVEDEGRYFCEISDFETGILLHNKTDVNVIAHSTPHIVQCQDESLENREINITDNSTDGCLYKMYSWSDEDSFQLTCSVIGVKPKVSLFWTINGNAIPNTRLSYTERDDGTYDITNTLMMQARSVHDKDEFVCTAIGVAVFGEANTTIRILQVGKRMDGMIAVTRESEPTGDIEEIRSGLSKSTKIPKENIWFFNNYTKTGQNEDNEKSIKFLNFLWECLKKGESNCVFQGKGFKASKKQAKKEAAGIAGTVAGGAAIGTAIGIIGGPIGMAVGGLIGTAIASTAVAGASQTKTFQRKSKLAVLNRNVLGKK